jgi:prepilin-type processing-associated H-X9-DG protein
VYTFLDVEEKSIDDGSFAFCFFSVTHSTWSHLPADRHRRGANLGYTDGHFAYQCWKWPKVFRQYDQEPANAQDRADLDFIREGTPRE